MTDERRPPAIIRRKPAAEDQSASPRLGQRGQIYVTLAAGQTFARDKDRAKGPMQIEEARRELTDLLIDAKCTREAEGPGAVAQYRARSRTTGLDISAQVTTDGRLLVVTSVSVRWWGG